jgi:hypothetical protein
LILEAGLVDAYWFLIDNGKTQTDATSEIKSSISSLPDFVCERICMRTINRKPYPNNKSFDMTPIIESLSHKKLSVGLKHINLFSKKEESLSFLEELVHHSFLQTQQQHFVRQNSMQTLF